MTARDIITRYETCGRCEGHGCGRCLEEGEFPVWELVDLSDYEDAGDDL